MAYKKYSLPAYGVERDMWDELASEKRPIVVYGMGNGADKLFLRLEKYGIQPADIFASDGFVRGHSFRGMRVRSFSEIKAEYSDFVILLSFASSREEVLELLSEINSQYDMYIPDMPVAGEDEYFDREFYNTHYSEILSAYESLYDEESRSAFAAIVNYKLTGKMEYLEDCYSTRDELYALLGNVEVRDYVDVGAYNGDTVREAMHYFGSLSRVIAVEPDPKTYKRLLKFTDTVDSINITTVNAAAWSEMGKGIFSSSGNRNSSISSTASYEHRESGTGLVTVDSLCERADFVKYDVEGAEYEALLGSHALISSSRPMLLVSLYHRSRDIFALTNYLTRKYVGYRIYLRRLRCVPAWEIDLILIPEDRLTSAAKDCHHSGN